MVVLSVVLLVGDLLEPLDGRAIERLLNGDVCHRCIRCGTVPVFLVRSDADDIARADLLDRTVPSLVEPAPERDDQRLSERMRVPVASRVRLERHICSAGPCGSARLEQGIEADRAREVFGRRLLRAPGAVSRDRHAGMPLRCTCARSRCRIWTESRPTDATGE